jgi:hypothetical protein
LFLFGPFGGLIRAFNFSLRGLLVASSLRSRGFRFRTLAARLCFRSGAFGFSTGAALGLQGLLLFRLSALLFGLSALLFRFGTLPFGLRLALRRRGSLGVEPCLLLPLERDQPRVFRSLNGATGRSRYGLTSGVAPLVFLGLLEELLRLGERVCGIFIGARPPGDADRVLCFIKI